MARTWKQRPSEIYAIEDLYAAYCFDKAVMTFGMSYEADLEQASREAKSVAAAKQAIAIVQNRWLTDEDEKPGTPTQRKFKDPAGMFASK